MSICRNNFKALGTDIELLVVSTDAAGATEALAAAEKQIHQLEAVFSRFRADSELSILNASGDKVCSPELFEVITLAMEARRLTNGRFDPTILNALVAAGYDRTFELLSDSPAAPHPVSHPCGGEVVLDPATRRVILGPGVQLDLGGIAKGWIADQALAELAIVGPALVNAGGDIASSRRIDEPWTAQLPGEDAERALAFQEGAVATSGTDKRNWLTTDGARNHHVIDPLTGRSSATRLGQVTAFASTCAEAEVHATRLLLAGDATSARAEADRLGIPAILTELSGEQHYAGGLA